MAYNIHQLNLEKLNSENEMKRLDEYQKAIKYYENETAQFVAEKIRIKIGERFKELRVNYCDPVVNALVSRLKVTNVRCEDEDVAKYLQSVWRKNKMDRFHIKNMRQAIKLGDSFVLVWPDEINKISKITVLDPSTCFPVYEDDEGTLLWFKRQWLGFNKEGAVTAFKFIYYPDRVERFYAMPDRTKTSIALSDFANMTWIEYTEDDQEAIIKHPYGMPFVHFANRPDDSPYGESEIHNIYGLQDAINSQIINLVRIGEFCGAKQGVLKGASPDDFPKDKNGNPMINIDIGDWLVISNPEGSVSSIDQSSPDGVVKILDTLIDKIAEVTRTPKAVLESSDGNAASGFALSKVEAPLIAKCNESQVVFGSCYEDVFKLILKQARAMGVSEAKEIDAYAEWLPLTEESPSDKYTKAQEMGIWIDKKVVSRAYARRELGLTNQEIGKIKEELSQETESDIMAAMYGLDHQSDPINDENSGDE